MGPRLGDSQKTPHGAYCRRPNRERKGKHFQLFVGMSEKEVQQSATLEEGPHQNLIMLAPWSWISSLQNFPNGFHLFLLNLEKKVHYRSLRRDESGQHFSSGDYLGTRAAYSER
ncbi:uncharacterized protein AAEQ78_000437 isoform 1-T7 [Lycaon pictus]